ncbi:MAG: hypothetical protein NC192_01835, partial [Muribaculaceae bacterium]|nr:hypothetical protein [Muribaculaceae bacterium]
MKRKLSFVLAVLMTASVMAGCKKTEETAEGIPDVGTTSAVSLTQMTTEASTTAETTTTETTTTAEEETTSEETTTESETEVTTLASETTTTAATTTATAATASAAAKKEWNETEISETLYIKTSCYSRTKAVVGSDAVKKYSAGTRIEIVAATDTGYYKLADGTFIHSDYVTDQAPSATTTAATTAKPVTTTTEDDGIIIDDSITTTAKPSTDTSSNGSYPKNFKDRYPYKQLSAKEQELYGNIVEAAYNFSSTADLPQGLDSDSVVKVYSIIFDNEPQLFWLSSTAPTVLGGSVTIKYAHSKKDAETYQAAIDKNRKEVMKTVNGYTSEISKIKAIFDWVVHNNSTVSHDEFASLYGTDANTIVNGVGGYGHLICNGYTKSFLYLCDYAGIDGMTVSGTNDSGESHAWNVVYCSNGYYIVDTDWGDP